MASHILFFYGEIMADLMWFDESFMVLYDTDSLLSWFELFMRVEIELRFQSL